MPFALVTLVVACKEKPRQAPPASSPPAAAPARSAPAPAPALPPPAAAADVDARDAGVEAAPSPSELALMARRKLFGKIGKLAKTTRGDCDTLGAELARMADEAREVARRRADLAGADVALDDAMVKTTLRVVTELSSACPDTARIDELLSLIGDVPD